MSYEFNMVDMGGIDIATVNGTVVEGLYNKLLEGKDACGNLILYNWKFAEIEIVPSACSVLIEDEAIIVNGTIKVDSSDVVSLIWADPPPVPVEPLVVDSNGVYTAEPPLSGFNPVSVNVPLISFVTDFEVLADEDSSTFDSANMTWGDITIVGDGAYLNADSVRFRQGSSLSSQSYAYFDLGEDNRSFTAYLVAKVYETPQYYPGNNLRILSSFYSASSRNTQEFYMKGGIVWTGMYGTDINTGEDAYSYHVFALRIDSSNRMLGEYVDFATYYKGSYGNSGRQISIAAAPGFGTSYYSNAPLEVKRIIITGGADSGRNIMNNALYLSNLYNI